MISSRLTEVAGSRTVEKGGRGVKGPGPRPRKYYVP